MKNIKLKKIYKKWIIVIIIAFVIMFRIGVMTPPLFLIKWHFNANRQSFQNIANLMLDKDYDDWGNLLNDENFSKSDFIKIKVFLVIVMCGIGWLIMK